MTAHYRKKDIQDIVSYINDVSDSLKSEIESEIDPLKRQTRTIVKNKLSTGHGVRKGIYKKHIVVRTLDKELGNIHFQVGANKGHHRLTHLLENGHRIKLHGVFLNHKTRKIVHIEPGQKYVDTHAIMLCKKALDKAFKKGKQ